MKKIKKYSRIKNWHFNFENALGQNFHTPVAGCGVWKTPTSQVQQINMLDFDTGMHRLRFHENPPFEIKLKTGAVAFS